MKKKDKTENLKSVKIGYIESNLSKDEKVLVSEKISGWCFKPVCYFLMVFEFIFLAAITVALFSNDKPPLPHGMVVFCLFTALLILWIWFSNTKTEMLVTNKRVVLKTGIFIHNTDELRLEKVEAANIKKSLLGLVFGYGDIIFSGTGGKKVIFKAIKQPQVVKNKIDEIFGEYLK